MKSNCRLLLASIALLLFTSMGTAYGITAGEKVKTKGLITARNGETLSMNTDAGNVVVVLSDKTKVGTPKGLLKRRTKNMAVTALVPGLRIEVQGVGDAGGRIMASSIRFSNDDLQTAQQIQAGLATTQQQVQENQGNIQTNQGNIQANQQNIGTNREQIQANKQQISANQEEIKDVNQRFSELKDYDTKYTASVNFAVGSSVISAKDKTELAQLAANAKGLTGYLVQVAGFADSSGDAALNQQLSQKRAEAVVAYLAQDGKVPLIHILAPGAMGTSNAASSNETAAGRAENRRVEVKVLVNRGLSARN